MADLDQIESTTPIRMEYQGIGIRFVSLVIDSLIISAIFGALATILGFGMMRHGAWSVGLLSFAFYIA